MEYYRGNTPISTGAVRQAVPVGSAQSTVHMPHAVASSQESLHSSSSFGRLPSAPVVVSAVPPERTLRNSAVLRPASPSKPISPSTVTTLHSGLPSPSGAQVAASTGELGNRGLSPRNSTLEVKFKQIEDRQVALDQRLNAMAGRLQHESIERPRQLEKSQAMYMTTALSDFASTITDDMISRLTSLKEDIDKQHRASADNQLKLQEQIQRLAENQSRLMEEDTMQRLQQMENMVGEALDRSQRTEAVLAEHEQRHNVHDSRIAGCEDRCRTSGERPDAQERGSLQAHEQMLQEAHGHSRSALEGLEALRGEFQVSLAELQAQLANVQAQLQALPLQQPVLDQASHPRREDFDALHGQVRAELHEHQQRISSEVLANSQSIVDQVRAEIQAEMQNHRQGLSEQVSAGSASELSSLTQRLQVVEESLVQLASAVQSAAQNDVQTREELDRLQKQTAQMSSTSRESGDIASELTGLANRVESVERNLQRQVAETTANLSESIAISNKKLDTHAEESMVLIRQLQKQRQSMQEELSGETGPLYKLRQDLSEVQQTLSSIPELHNQLSCLQSEARGLQEVRQRLDSSVSAQAEAQAQAAQAQQEGQAKVQAEILADLQQHRQSLTEQAEALREVRERLSSAAVGASAGAAPQEAPMASSDITYGRNSFAVPAESPAVAQGRNSFAVPAESPVPVVQEVAEMPAAPAVTLRRPSCESQLVSPPSVPATPPAAVRGNGHQLVSPPSVPATPPAAVNREVAVEPVHQIRYLAPLECTGSPESISRLTSVTDNTPSASVNVPPAAEEPAAPAAPAVALPVPDLGGSGEGGIRSSRLPASPARTRPPPAVLAAEADVGGADHGSIRTSKLPTSPTNSKQPARGFFSGEEVQRSRLPLSPTRRQEAAATLAASPADIGKVQTSRLRQSRTPPVRSAPALLADDTNDGNHGMIKCSSLRKFVAKANPEAQYHESEEVRSSRLRRGI